MTKHNSRTAFHQNFVFFLFFLSIPSLVMAKITFFDDFEEGQLDLKKWHHNGIGVARVVQEGVDGPPKARSGKFCTRHSVSSPKYRDELVPTGLIKRFNYNNEYWIGISYYIPDGPNIEHARTILQVHASNPEERCDCLGGKNPSGSSLITLTEVDKGHLHLSIKTELQQKEGVCEHFPIRVTTVWESKSGNRNKWHDFVFHFKVHESKGFLEAYHRLSTEKSFTKIHSHQGTTAELFNGCGKPIPLEDRYYYFKMGSYARYLSHLPEGVKKHNEVFIDEIRFGDANSSISEVAPGGGVPLIVDDQSTPPRKPRNLSG